MKYKLKIKEKIEKYYFILEIFKFFRVFFLIKFSNLKKQII